MPAHSLTDEISQLVTDETRHNAVASRSNAPVDIQHYEIPLDEIESDVAARVPRNIRSSLIFTRGGRQFVRWVINPEDTQWHLSVRRLLERRGLDATPKRFFTGYMTASRSYIVENPRNGAQFSVKVSTNRTGGNWRDKKQDWSDARQIRRMADFMDARLKDFPLKHLITMDEPAGFGIPQLNQGMVIRTLAELPSGGKRYLPGFAALHDSEGRRIARRNGSRNPAEFWNEHYNKPLARALAELFSMTGLTYDSPHSQNFLIELDENDRPTGRIVARDFGDSYLSREYFRAAGAMDIYRIWERDNRVSGNISVGAGPLHGNSYPSWMGRPEYVDWSRTFFREFNSEISRIAQATPHELGRSAYELSGRYYTGDYDISARGWERFLGAVERGPQEIKRFRCEGLFFSTGR